MPGETGVTVVSMLVCFVSFRTRGCGCIKRPAFPAPSVFRRDNRFAKLGRIAPRGRGGISQIRHPRATALPLSLEVRALRCTCTAGRASKDERTRAVVLRDASRSLSSDAHSRDPLAMLLRMTEMV